jgi:hypothetical protein
LGGWNQKAEIKFRWKKRRERERDSLFGKLSDWWVVEKGDIDGLVCAMFVRESVA